MHTEGDLSGAHTLPKQMQLKIKKIALSVGAGADANLQIEVKNTSAYPTNPTHLRLDFYDTDDRRFQSVTVTLPEISPGATHECTRYIRLRQKNFFRFTVRQLELAKGQI